LSRASLLLLALLALSSAARGDDLLQALAQARAAAPTLLQAEAICGAPDAAALTAGAALLPQWRLSQVDLRDACACRAYTTTSSLSQALIDLAAQRQWDVTRSVASAEAERFAAARQAARQRVAAAYLGLLTAQDELNTEQPKEGAFDRQVEVDQLRASRELGLNGTLEAELTLSDSRETLVQRTGLPAPPRPHRRDNDAR
jgi:outer membrane protein